MENIVIILALIIFGNSNLIAMETGDNEDKKKYQQLVTTVSYIKRKVSNYIDVDLITDIDKFLPDNLLYNKEFSLKDINKLIAEMLDDKLVSEYIFAVKEHSKNSKNKKRPMIDENKENITNNSNKKRSMLQNFKNKN